MAILSELGVFLVTVTQTQASSINPFGESETNPFQVFGDNTGMFTLLSKLNKH